MTDRISGRVVTPSDEDFAEIAFDRQWNRLRPARTPDVIVCVDNERDVAEAVRFAVAEGLRVAVRGGGHNWCNPALRSGGMLIDLANLDQIVSIDRDARTAVVQPILSNRQVQAALNEQGLSYPTGHCPQVKLSGYLLGGGMAWNQGTWGEGFQSVEAIELVTPQGELITASEDENADYFWAARGAGSNLFAAAVRFHLRLHPLPRAIWTCSYHFALEDAEVVADWLESIAPSLPPMVELTLFLVHAPPELAGRCEASNGKACLVTATAFADSSEDAGSALEPLAKCPVAEPIARQDASPTDFPSLFDLSGSMWPEGQRSQVDAMYFDKPLPELVRATRDRFMETPSETTLLLFALFTGPDVPAPLPDAAFSMSARIYGGPWTMWSEASDDAGNAEWHSGCVDALAPLSVGHYVGESDTVGRREFAQASYSADSWTRLAELRRQHDPDGVFFTHTEGLD